MKVFIVSQNPMIDFGCIKDTVVDTISNPIDASTGVIKVEAEVLYNNPDDMGILNDGDPDQNKKNSIAVTSKCPLQTFERNLSKKTVMSSITNVETMKLAETKFNLHFVHQTGLNPLLKVKKPHELQLLDQPISKSIDIVVRRKNYNTFPIQWLDSEGKPYTAFIITAAGTVGTVTYGPINVPKGGDVIHYGASVRLDNANKILIDFEIVSSYLTKVERDAQMKLHTAKHLELLCLDQEDGSLLGSIGFQVVCEPRIGLKRKKEKVSNNDLPMVNCVETRWSFLDLEEHETNREATIEELQQLIPQLTTKKLTYMISLGKFMAAN